VPLNIAGQKYDLRPYWDEIGRLVIVRGANTIAFTMHKENLRYSVSGHYHIDRLDLEKAKKQARAIFNKKKLEN
jgi:hypothetical protein